MSALRRFLDPDTVGDLLRIGGMLLCAYGLGALSVLASTDALRAAVAS